MSEFTNELAELVKAAGQELIDRADDLVGQGNMLSDFEIHIRFPQPIDRPPTITITREYLSKNCIDILCH